MSKSTIKASIIEAGNGLPYLGDLVYSGETNMVYKITACSRVQVGGNGKGNSVQVTLIEAGDPDDYTEAAFSDILDCRIDLEETSCSRRHVQRRRCGRGRVCIYNTNMMRQDKLLC